MYWKDKIHNLRMPIYAIFAVIFFAGVVGLYLPTLFNMSADVAEASYAPISFSTPVSVVNTVPANSNVRMLSVGSTFYVAFTSSTGATHNVYVTKSTNGGATWSNPVLAFSSLFLENSANPYFSSFVYNTYRNELSIVAASGGDLSITTSTVAASSWSSPTTIVSGGAGTVLGRAAIAFSTSTGMYAVAYLSSSQNSLFIATSTSGASWSTSTISNVSSTYSEMADQYKAFPLALDVRGNTIQIVYDMNITSPATAYELVYGISSNLGGSWTTSTITGQIVSPTAQMSGFSALSSAAFDNTGNPGAVYYSVLTVDIGTLSQTSMPIYTVKTGETWTTSSFHGGVSSFTLGAQGLTGSTAMSYFSSNFPLILYVDNNTYPALAVNTSSAFSTNTISASALQLASYQAMAYSTSSQSVAAAFVTGSALKFSTSTLRDVTQNTAPVAEVSVAPSFSTAGDGRISVTGTILDADNDVVSFIVEHSIDNGSTWSSSTLAVASSTLSSSLTKSVGQVTGISLANTTQTFNFVWDTQTDGVTSTSQFKIRMTPYDDYNLAGTTITSAAFTVDNVAPSAPNSFSTSYTTSTIDFTWLDVTGASTYTVSTTAGTATTTSATTTEYSGLTPNTRYYFQVKSIDSYNNISSFSSPSSVYTDPVSPTTVVASSGGTTSMTVTWLSGGNSSSTVYQLYNDTLSSVVATTTDLTYTVTGLTASTNYQFAVRAQSLGDSGIYSAYSSTSTAVSTDAVPATPAPSSGGGASAPVPAPIIPIVLISTPPASVPAVFSIGVSTPVSVGASSHTVTVANASASSVTLTIQSEPIKLTLKKGETRDLDTNVDGIKDIRLTYLGLVNNKPQIKFVTLADDGELKNPMTINSGLYETKSTNVQLTFNSSDAVQMAVSNSNDFTGASFVPFAKTLNWSLLSGNGTKTVYAKLRSKLGGMVSVSDSIELVGDSSAVSSPTKIDSTTKAVTPIKHRQLRSGMRGTDVTALQTQLKAMGFFPKSVKINGRFGPTTLKAVKAFQKANKISAIGIVGPATWKALDSSL